MKPKQEGEEELNFIATKSCLEFDHDKAIVDLKSQGLINSEPNHSVPPSDAAYLSSVTSLVARLPAFDYVEH